MVALPINTFGPSRHNVSGGELRTLAGNTHIVNLNTVRSISLEEQETLKKSLLFLDGMASWGDNWNGHDVSAPLPLAIETAKNWLISFFELLTPLQSQWEAPNIAASGEGQVVFEWWSGAKKITLYISPKQVDYVKVWGDNIWDEMDDGTIDSPAEFYALWWWLHRQD